MDLQVKRGDIMEKGNLIELIKSRRSIRSFESKKLEFEELKNLVEAAIWAPSGSNIQPWFFGIISNDEVIEKIKFFSPGLFGNPPNLIVLCVNKKIAYEKGGELGKELCIYDIAMAAQNILLCATDKGLATCCIKSFNQKAVNKILLLPEHISSELIISVGQAKRVPKPPKRKNLSKITFKDNWGNFLNEE